MYSFKYEKVFKRHNFAFPKYKRFDTVAMSFMLKRYQLKKEVCR